MDATKLCACNCGKPVTKVCNTYLHGHATRGKKHAAILSEREVLGIKRKLADKRYKWKHRQIAGFYGVSIWTIHAISQGRIWKELVV